MSSKKIKIVLPVLLLIAGVAGGVLLSLARKAPPRVEQPVLGPLVEVVQVEPSSVTANVTGYGEVGAKIEVNLVPEVSGRIVQVHPSMVSGGFFRAGEDLVVIDPRDYELAVDRAAAAVARAEVGLERERAEAEVARQEWNALHPGEEPTSGLVVREPQERQAAAELEAARADLRLAQLRLERTRLSVPFDGVVVTEQVDVGQFVSMGASLAMLYSTESVEIRVPLEDRELAWFDVPDRDNRAASKAEVRVEFAGAAHLWEGLVTRLEARVDSESRMVHVIVEVSQPFERRQGRPPLLPGTFVEVSIHGHALEDVIAVPRHAIREGATVWIVHEGRLQIRKITILRSDRDVSLVTAGLEPGERIVTSSLDAVTDGMAVRTIGDLGAEQGGNA